jgi:paraquat-inducible protein B
MTTYAKIENGNVTSYPLSEGDIRNLFPNTSFPTNNFQTPDGFVLVEATATPSINFNQKITEASPQLVDGKFQQVWNVVTLSSQELTQKTSEREITIRAIRNKLLMDSDWSQYKDIPESVSTPWATYRQALRDITNQSGFPIDVTFPTAP